MVATLIYLVRFALLCAAEWAVLYWLPSAACKPLSHLQQETTTVGAIPPDATCYTVEHGNIVFSHYRAFVEDPVPYILTAGLLMALLLMFSWPRFRRKWQTDPSDHANVVAARSSAAAAKAGTSKEFAIRFWEWYGPGPVVVFAAIAALAVVTAFPPFAAYRALVFFGLAPAALALYLWRPNLREQPPPNPTSE